MSLFGGRYQLGPGDAVPFPGSLDEERANFLTHKFEVVDPNPEFQVIERCSV